MKTDQQLELQKWEYEQKLAQAARAHDKVDEFVYKGNEAAINGSNLALRMLMLINGGAAVALLAFISHLDKAHMSDAADSLVWFAWGVTLAVVGLLLAYCTNYCMTRAASSLIKTYDLPYLEEGPTTSGWEIAQLCFHFAAFVAGIGSLALFVVGMTSIRSTIQVLG